MCQVLGRFATQAGSSFRHMLIVVALVGQSGLSWILVTHVILNFTNFGHGTANTVPLITNSSICVLSEHRAALVTLHLDACNDLLEFGKMVKHRLVQKLHLQKMSPPEALPLFARVPLMPFEVPLSFVLWQLIRFRMVACATIS